MARHADDDKTTGTRPDPSRRSALLTLAGAAVAAAGGAWWWRSAASASEGSQDAIATPSEPLPRGRAPVSLFYTSAYVGAAHAFETTRKAAWVAQSLIEAPIPGLQLTTHHALTADEVLAVHAPAYVEAVRTGEPRDLAQSQGFPWDAALWPMVVASNGGAVAAARAALATGGIAGALASGLHHARRDHGAGFCTFNGLAIAALQALAGKAKRVLILDFDAHCGGGTHSLLGEHPAVRIVDVAVDGFDAYLPLGANTLDRVTSADAYLPTISRRLAALDGDRFDLCLYNAGMDPHEGCPVGGLAGIDAAVLGERERVVFDWARQRKLPLAFVLAGGYLGPALAQDELVALHRLTLAAAAQPPR